jgi:hypothetical protein
MDLTNNINKHNLWLRLPPELQTQVLDQTDPLTQYLNDHGPYKKQQANVNLKLSIEIWKVVFQIEWDGPLDTLPKLLPTIHTGLDLVKTQSMLYRLCDAFPDKFHYNHAYSDHDYSYHESMQCWLNALSAKLNAEGTVLEVNEPFNPGCTGFVHIIFRHKWLDCLDADNADANQAYEHAVYGVHLDYLEHVERTYPTDPDTFPVIATLILAAAYHGNIKVLETLRQTWVYHDLFDSRVMDWAARGGKLDTLEYLHDHFFVRCSFRGFMYAAHCDMIPCNGSPSIDVGRFLVEHFPETLDLNGIRMAARLGNMDLVLLYLEKKRPDLSNSDDFHLMDDAAAGGNLELIQYLHENKIGTCTQHAMDGSARCGHLHIVEFLHTHRSEGCTKDAMHWAACNGHLDVVEFLHFNRTEGCDTLTVSAVIQRGHLEVLKFLMAHRTEGRPTLFDFNKSGDVDVRRYMKENHLGREKKRYVQELAVAIREMDLWTVESTWDLFEELPELDKCTEDVSWEDWKRIRGFFEGVFGTVEAIALGLWFPSQT